MSDPTPVPSNPADAQAFRGTPGILLGMCLGVSIYWLFALSIGPLLPSIAREFGIGAADPGLAFAVSLAGLTAGICVMPAGGLADRLGRVRLVRLGLAVGLAGALLCGFAPGLGLLTAGRFLLGLSSALVMPSTLGLVKAYYSDEDRPRAISYWSLSTFGCASLSSLFGGVMATHVGWRWAFLLAVPCILAAYVLLRHAPERRAEGSQSGRRFDLAGLAALVIGLLALNLFVAKGKQWGWTSPQTLGALALFALMTALFIPHERRHPSPIADLSLFSRAAFTGSVAANLLINTLLGVLVVIMVYLQKGRGLTAMQASLLTLGYAAAIMATIRVGERLARRTGPRLPTVLGALCNVLMVVCLSFTSIQSNALYFTLVFIGLTATGMGLGLFATPATGVAVNEAPPEKAALAGGIFKMGSSLGGAFGIAIHLAVFGAVLGDGGSIHQAAQSSIRLGLVAGLASAAVAFLLIPGRARKAAPLACPAAQRS